MEARSYIGLKSAIVCLVFITTFVSAKKAESEIQNMGSLASLLDQAKINMFAKQVQTEDHDFK